MVGGVKSFFLCLLEHGVPPTSRGINIFQLHGWHEPFSLSDIGICASFTSFFLAGSITANLALLGYFKYANFLADNINVAFNAGYVLPQILLPLGISFFTFTQIAYLVDSYRGEAKEYDFLNYALFVTFFPHLIAGPILHHREMMPQFESRWNLAVRFRNIVLGLFIFSIGLFKKVVIADTFAIWANAGYDGKNIS